MKLIPVFEMAKNTAKIDKHIKNETTNLKLNVEYIGDDKGQHADSKLYENGAVLFKFTGKLDEIPFDIFKTKGLTKKSGWNEKYCIAMKKELGKKVFDYINGIQKFVDSPAAMTKSKISQLEFPTLDDLKAFYENMPTR